MCTLFKKISLPNHAFTLKYSLDNSAYFTSRQDKKKVTSENTTL